MWLQIWDWSLERQKALLKIDKNTDYHHFCHFPLCPKYYSSRLRKFGMVSQPLSQKGKETFWEANQKILVISVFSVPSVPACHKWYIQCRTCEQKRVLGKTLQSFSYSQTLLKVRKNMNV